MLPTSTLVTEPSMKLHLAFKVMTTPTEFKKQRKFRNGFGYSLLDVLTVSVTHLKEFKHDQAKGSL